MITFDSMNLDPALIAAIKEEAYDKPTPIQEKAIPIIERGKDLIGQAQTGSGKTAAFAIPILNRLCKIAPEPDSYNKVKAIVLAPTRELALQIGESFHNYGRYTSVGTGVIFGGVTPKRHMKVLKREPRVIVATPGRLLDFIQQDVIELSDVELLVLDEADRMLELGMLEDVKAIIRQLPKQRQNLLFSATMSGPVKELAKSICKDPETIVVKGEKKNLPKITQYVYFVEETHKAERLIDFLKFETYESVLVFVRTKGKADRLAKTINISNIRTRALHGDLNQSERVKVLTMFKNKEISVLIATDVASRGIDIDRLSHVINFNVPNVAETYVHRIGRTGRAGEAGISISYCSKVEEPFLKRIEALQGTKLTVKNKSQN